MIDIHFPPTPNGYKIPIFCEEAGLPYRLIRHALGDQFTQPMLKLSPNNKLPVIVDHEPADKGAPVSVFETGAILTYLAEKTGKFLPADFRKRAPVFEWLFWQVAGLGPISGQRTHFHRSAPEKLAYPMERFARELGRLFAVLDHQLENREFIADEYSIADMAVYPWIAAHGFLEIQIVQFPQVQRWLSALAERPAIKRAYEKGKATVAAPATGYSKEQEWTLQYGQTSELVRRAYNSQPLFD
jgi:GST-like protein